MEAAHAIWMVHIFVCIEPVIGSMETLISSTELLDLTQLLLRYMKPIWVQEDPGSHDLQKIALAFQMNVICSLSTHGLKE